MENEMKYRMIFCDYDGTLAHSDSKMSDYTQKVIKQYVAKGGKFVLCTGRLDISARKFSEQLGLDKAQPISVVSLQGGVVIDNAKNPVRYESMDSDSAYAIIKAFEDSGVYVHCYDHENVFVQEYNEINLDYKRLCDVSLKVVGRVSEFVKKNSFNPVKILAVIPADEVEKNMKLIADLGLKDIQYFMASRTYFECIPKSSGKETGMKTVADYYGIPLDSVMAFGDNGNDVNMIAQAGFGVAVANARREAKAVADLVCESNDDDGVAKTIERLCL